MAGVPGRGFVFELQCLQNPPSGAIQGRRAATVSVQQRDSLLYLRVCRPC